MQASTPHIAYLFSRYPVVSQTFCDTEMLALEGMGFRITVGSLNPPPTSFRHERLKNLQAEIVYPPPAPALDFPLSHPPDEADWKAMAELAARHEEVHGKSFKALTRARNAWWVARELRRRGIRHVHVHFANRATHTALFLKKAGFTFSFTAHAQDFMIDLGSDDLLREMAREAEFVIAVSDYSRELLQRACPDAAEKIVRIYNGLDLAGFTAPAAAEAAPLRILSVGRLIEFKGFHHLIDAVSQLRNRSVATALDIVGEGPWRERLEQQIAAHGLENSVRLLGVRSQDEVKEMLTVSHVFALACVVDSKGASDILPTVILEAMATGRPVVSTRLAGVPEMVESDVTGLLSEPGNSAQLADHLAALAADPVLRTQMGAAGRRKLESTFTIAKTAAELGGHFRALPTAMPSESKIPPARCLALLASWKEPEAEADVLTRMDGVRVLCARCDSPPASLNSGIDFLPDAMVLEGAWRNEPELASGAEALYGKCGPVDGEAFFQAARRAVHTVVQARKWGIRHVHAFRSDTILWTWLAGRLGGLGMSAAIESRPALGRKALETILPDFSFGSNSDQKLSSSFPDLLHLGEPPSKGSFFGKGSSKPDVDHESIWKNWLSQIPG